MTHDMCLHFSMQEEDILENTIVKRNMSTLSINL